MKSGDFLVILCVLLLAGASAAFFWRGSEHQAAAVVSWHGETAARLPLSGSEGVYSFGDRGQVEILVENGRVRFLVSDCPDQMCVKSGWLDRPGRMAACLPNRCLVVIEDMNAEEPDVVIFRHVLWERAGETG